VAPGGEVLVEVKLTEQFDGCEDQVGLELPDEVKLIAGPARFIRKEPDPKSPYRFLSHEYVVDYKLRPTSEGVFDLKFTVAGKELTVPLVAGQKVGARAPPYEASGLGATLLFPPRAGRPADSMVEHIRIGYPEAEFPFLWWNMWWVWPFLIISMVAALAVKGVFKVEI